MKTVSAVATFFAALLATLALAAPSTHAATIDKSVKQEASANLNIDLDVLEIGKTIAGAIGMAENREAFVKDLRNKAYFAANSPQAKKKSDEMGFGSKGYNVMVFNLAVDHSDRLRGVRFYGSAKYGDLIYGIWVFRSGTFENKGDGGFINWAFRGKFDRDEGKVEFRR